MSDVVDYCDDEKSESSETNEAGKPARGGESHGHRRSHHG